MIERFKAKLWDLLQAKDVSLIILFDKEGDILWTKGRRIKGKTLSEGGGFSKSYMEEVLNGKDSVQADDVVVDMSNDDLSESAALLYIKSLLILPIDGSFYLYIDSGIRKKFSEKDIEVLRVLGEMLGEIIGNIRQSEAGIGGITGSSEVTQKIRDLVLKYAIEDSSVLLLGETGVGKSHIAELIHRFSGRKGRLVVINTPSIPHDLFESELFGHKKGAFTDAREDKDGFVTEAEGGTLFFDEISEVPLTFQSKLLRFIETKKYNRLGDPNEHCSDIRIIAATNKDLSQAVEGKEFRGDLYYRLNILQIKIPPLRERKTDIRPLIEEKKQLLKGKQTTDEFWKELEAYSWPGNIRELFTLITRVGIHANDPITGVDVREMLTDSGVPAVNPSVRGFLRKKKQIEEGESFWDVWWRPFIDRDIDRRAIGDFLKETYGHCQNNFRDMVDYLNVDQKDYHKFLVLLKKYKIHPKIY